MFLPSSIHPCCLFFVCEEDNAISFQTISLKPCMIMHYCYVMMIFNCVVDPSQNDQMAAV